MNNEVYRRLDKEEIITKDHYWYHWQNNTFVLLPPNDPWIGKKADGRSICEKISLDDFRILKNDEIVNDEHFEVSRNQDGYLVISRCYYTVGMKAGYLRKANSCISGYNLYAKEENKFNFGKFDFLKEIEL
jgi:hypothetical protein